MTIAIIGLALLAPLSTAAQAPPKTDEQRLSEFTALAISHQANKEAFRFGTFKFEYTSGASRGYEDALAGRFSIAYTGQGLYIFDGKNSRFERNFAIDDLAKARRKSPRTGIDRRLIRYACCATARSRSRTTRR